MTFNQLRTKFCVKYYGLIGGAEDPYKLKCEAKMSVHGNVCKSLQSIASITINMVMRRLSICRAKRWWWPCQIFLNTQFFNNNVPNYINSKCCIMCTALVLSVPVLVLCTGGGGCFHFILLFSFYGALQSDYRVVNSRMVGKARVQNGHGRRTFARVWRKDIRESGNWMGLYIKRKRLAGNSETILKFALKIETKLLWIICKFVGDIMSNCVRQTIKIE